MAPTRLSRKQNRALTHYTLFGITPSLVYKKKVSHSIVRCVALAELLKQSVSCDIFIVWLGVALIICSICTDTKVVPLRSRQGRRHKGCPPQKPARIRAQTSLRQQLVCCHNTEVEKLAQHGGCSFLPIFCLLHYNAFDLKFLQAFL